MFLVVVQLGAILAVVLLFWNKIFPLKRNRRRQLKIDWNIMNLWGKIVAACVPAAIVGVLFDDWLEEHLYNFWVVILYPFWKPIRSFFGQVQIKLRYSISHYGRI